MAGLTIGGKDVCMFSMEPLSEMTAYHSSEIAVVMAYLVDKVNQDPENIKEVFDIHMRLFKAFTPKVYVELEKPLHVGIHYLIHSIRTAGVPIKPYFRQE
jgi:DUF438 domain-containing protein